MQRKLDLTKRNKVLVGTMSTEERCFACQYVQIMSDTGGKLKLQTSLMAHDLIPFLDELDSIKNFISSSRHDMLEAAIEKQEKKVKKDKETMDNFDFQVHSEKYGEENAELAKVNVVKNWEYANEEYMKLLEYQNNL